MKKNSGIHELWNTLFVDPSPFRRIMRELVSFWGQLFRAMEPMDCSSPDCSHLAYLEAQPTRADPLFGGDYGLYRKKYKAWHKRQKITAQGTAAPTGMAARPRSKAPKVDGVACTWDGEHACWRSASGETHDAAAKRKSRKQDDEAAVQEQRRIELQLIEEEVQRRFFSPLSSCVTASRTAMKIKPFGGPRTEMKIKYACGFNPGLTCR